jgi:hypothetical protein
MASNHKRLQEETQLPILRLLHENPEISTRAIADCVGVSNSGAFYCLIAFIEKGQVKLGNFTASPHKNRYAYILTPRGLTEKRPSRYAFWSENALNTTRPNPNLKPCGAKLNSTTVRWPRPAREVIDLLQKNIHRNADQRRMLH